MAAQSLAIGSINHADVFVWRGLRLFRAMGIGVMAGLAAGFVAGGIGSRLAMKIVAIVAGATARGRITENGNTIGDFTASGTIFLLLFGAMLGTIGGLLYMALRPWLASAGRWRGVAFGAILLATIRAGTIDSENFDFTRFGIPALNVALFAALPIVFGLLVASWADWIDRRVPVPALERVSALGMAGGIGLAALAVLPVALLGALFAGIDSVPMPLVVAALLLSVAGYVMLGARLFPAGDGWRIPRLGSYLLTISVGVLGFFPLALLFVGVVANSDERGETRLGMGMLLFLVIGGIAGRLWPTRDGGSGTRRLMVALLAVPVLVGLAVTLREIGVIVFGL